MTSLIKDGLSASSAASELSKMTGQSKRTLYELIHKSVTKEQNQSKAVKIKGH